MDNAKRMKSAANRAVGERNYRRARERALTRLAQAYPDEYKKYLQEEKANDKIQGKSWVDLNGSNNRGGTSLHPDPSGTFTSTHTENEVHYGGKA